MNDFKILDKVLYNGQNRPWLHDSVGTIVGVNTSQSSFMVDFRNNVTGKLYTEWVGKHALKVYAEVGQYADLITSLEKQLSEVRMELESIANRHDELGKTEIKLASAISALKKL